MQLTKFRLKRLKNRETGRVMIMPKAIMCVPMCVCVCKPVYITYCILLDSLTSSSLPGKAMYLQTF